MNRDETIRLPVVADYSIGADGKAHMVSAEYADVPVMALVELLAPAMGRTVVGGEIG